MYSIIIWLFARFILQRLSDAAVVGDIVVVDVGKHEADVGGEEVVHLLAEAGLADQPWAAQGVTADEHGEEARGRRPVGDPREGMCHQDLLQEFF